MKMYIQQNEYYSYVKQDLRALCADPGLKINDATGEVTFAPTSSSQVNETLAQLANSPVGIGISGQGGGYPIPEPAAPNQVLRERAGFTLFDVYPGTTSVDIYYDVEQGKGCNGRGYFVEGAGGKPVPYPTPVSLFHELTHVRHLITQGFSAGLASAEADAIREENQLRKAIKLSERTGYKGGCNATPPQKPSEGSGGDKGNSQPPPRPGGCFVATAALEDNHLEKLDTLRAFRDVTLKENARADAFFKRFYSYYYQFSPHLAEWMRRDDDLRQLVLVALALPLANYYKLAINLPTDTPPANLSGEWRDFIEDVVADVQEWATLGVPPLSLKPDSYTAQEFDQDVEFVCRYVLRNKESRDQFLQTVGENTASPERDVPSGSEDGR